MQCPRRTISLLQLLAWSCAAAPLGRTSSRLLDGRPAGERKLTVTASGTGGKAHTCLAWPPPRSRGRGRSGLARASPVGRRAAAEGGTDPARPCSSCTNRAAAGAPELRLIAPPARRLRGNRRQPGRQIPRRKTLEYAPLKRRRCHQRRLRPRGLPVACPGPPRRERQ